MTKPYQLGVHLGIAIHKLDEIECDYPGSIKQQRIEVIKYWLKEMHPKASWIALADAVKKMRIYGNLATQLTQQHENLQAWIAASNYKS